MRNYEKFIGETKGIFTLLKIKDHNKGIFKCSVCNKEHEGNMNAWIYGGRKRCGMGKTGHKLYNSYVGRFQKNKVSYSTKSYKTPEEAYEALQQLKSTL